MLKVRPVHNIQQKFILYRAFFLYQNCSPYSGRHRGSKTTEDIGRAAMFISAQHRVKKEISINEYRSANMQSAKMAAAFVSYCEVNSFTL
jgi:hypothetical protein